MYNLYIIFTMTHDKMKEIYIWGKHYAANTDF